MSIQEELQEALDRINELNIPAAIVSHPKVRQVLRDREAEISGGKINGIPMYAFEDVPQDKSVVFYDRKMLNDYLRYRNERGVGHELALAKVMLDKHIKDGGYEVDQL